MKARRGSVTEEFSSVQDQTMDVARHETTGMPLSTAWPGSKSPVDFFYRRYSTFGGAALAELVFGSSTTTVHESVRSRNRCARSLLFNTATVARAQNARQNPPMIKFRFIHQMDTSLGVVCMTAGEILFRFWTVLRRFEMLLKDSASPCSFS